MPDPKVYEDTLATLDELEESLSGDYPDTLDVLVGARSALEAEHEGMGEGGEEAEGEGFPPELEGEEEDVDPDEDMAPGGPLGELPPGLEDEEEEDEELPPL